MADIDPRNAASVTRLIGADTSGVESEFVAVTPTQDIKNADIQNTSVVHTVVTVGTTEVEMKVGGSPLANRKELIISNLGNKDIRIGVTGVSADDTTPSANLGLLLGAGEERIFSYGASVALYAITKTGTANVIVWEAS